MSDFNVNLTSLNQSSTKQNSFNWPIRNPSSKPGSSAHNNPIFETKLPVKQRVIFPDDRSKPFGGDDFTDNSKKNDYFTNKNRKCVGKNMNHGQNEDFRNPSPPRSERNPNRNFNNNRQQDYHSRSRERWNNDSNDNGYIEDGNNGFRGFDKSRLTRQNRQDCWKRQKRSDSDDDYHHIDWSEVDGSEPVTENGQDDLFKSVATQTMKLETTKETVTIAIQTEPTVDYLSISKFRIYDQIERQRPQQLNVNGNTENGCKETKVIFISESQSTSPVPFYQPVNRDPRISKRSKSFQLAAPTN